LSNALVKSALMRTGIIGPGALRLRAVVREPARLRASVFRGVLYEPFFFTSERAYRVAMK
jgi:hypothetical protein